MLALYGFRNLFILGLSSIATDEISQLHGGLKKVKIEGNNSHKIQDYQNNILNKKIEGYF